MTRYVLSRLAVFFPIVIVVTFVSFFLMHLLPGNPVDIICGTGCTSAGRAQLTHQLGFDKPFIEQYWLYLRHIATGNLGMSYISHRSVTSILGQELPITLELMVLSQILALALAIPFAIFSGLRPDQRFDRSASLTSFGMLAAPSFVVATLLVFLFAVKIHIFPATGFTNLTQNPVENLKDMVLPVATLAIGSVAPYYRILRADMIATLQEDFVTMARAKGHSIRYIVLRHAFRPSVLTFVTVVGLYIGTLIGGAFIIEFIFQLPGIGYGTLVAIEQNDYLVVQGTVLVVTIGFVFVNLFADILNAVLDPRVRKAAVGT